ncbi:hypothetical protein GTQ40_16485 [Flavobacteriaceae bacterium R38]|nr:hypothetical protein [Flavobacteriaceae bacterium R38]
MKKNRKLALGKITIAAINNSHTLKGGTGDTGACVPDTFAECNTVACNTNVCPPSPSDPCSSPGVTCNTATTTDNASEFCDLKL